MRSLFKLSVIILLTIGYIVVAGILYLADLRLQILLAGVTSLGFVFRAGLRAWLKSLRVLLPLVISLMLVYIVFAVIGFKPAKTHLSATEYWLAYGGVRALILVSSIFFMRFWATFLSFDDLLSLPFSIHFHKHLILGKTLYLTAFNQQGRLKEQISLIPSVQRSVDSGKGIFRNNIVYLLALLYLIINESTHLGELIDNRIHTCHEETI